MSLLGGNLYEMRRSLLWATEMQVVSVTEKSARRTEMVRQQERREALRQTLSREEFLASLKVATNLFALESETHPRCDRAFERINKTNQFNTTGRRWTREECAAAFRDGSIFHAFEVKDDFTRRFRLDGCLLDDVGHRFRPRRTVGPLDHSTCMRRS